MSPRRNVRTRLHSFSLDWTFLTLSQPSRDVMLEVVRWVVRVKRRALFRDTSLRSPVRHQQYSRCTGQRGTVKAAANTRTDRAWRREPVDTSKHQRIMDAATGKFSTGASSLYCRLIDVRVGPSRALPRGP